MGTKQIVAYAARLFEQIVHAIPDLVLDPARSALYEQACLDRARDFFERAKKERGGVAPVEPGERRRPQRRYVRPDEKGQTGR